MRGTLQSSNLYQAVGGLGQQGQHGQDKSEPGYPGSQAGQGSVYSLDHTYHSIDPAHIYHTLDPAGEQGQQQQPGTEI